MLIKKKKSEYKRTALSAVHILVYLASENTLEEAKASQAYESAGLDETTKCRMGSVTGKMDGGEKGEQIWIAHYDYTHGKDPIKSLKTNYSPVPRSFHKASN